MAKTKKKSIGRKDQDTAYLTKRDLVRAIDKATRHTSARALQLKGSILTVEGDWVVKVHQNGKKEKVSKIDKADSTKISLD